MENDKKKLEFDMFKKQKEMELEKEKEEQKKRTRLWKKQLKEEKWIKKKLIYDCNKKDLQLKKKKK